MHSEIIIVARIKLDKFECVGLSHDWSFESMRFIEQDNKMLDKTLTMIYLWDRPDNRVATTQNLDL